MANGYAELLDATIRHLESLKSSGTRYIDVSPQTLAALNRWQPAATRSVAPVAKLTTVKMDRPVATPSTRPVYEVRAPKLEEKPRPTSPEVQSGSGRSQAAPAAVGGAASTGLAAALSPEAKAAAFAELRQRALQCVKCPHLAASRRNVVFGVGNPDAELMFVGEAPGADEDEQGEPFVGKAGQLLTKIIEAIGLKRDLVYIANILKCRPDTPGQNAGNRKPRPEEMETCIPFLHEQIDLIRPKVLVALGGTAMEGLLGKNAGIMRLRGQWHTYRGIPLMPTFHPAYVLRNQAPTEKRKVWEDMLLVMERLDLPITEKQRGFFAKT